MSNKIYLTPESKRESILRNKKNYYLRNKERLLEERKEFAKANPDKVKEWNRNSRMNPKNRAKRKVWYNENRDKIAAYKIKWALTEKGKASITETAKRNYLKNKNKYLARHYVANALKKGLLEKKDCIMCGNNKVEAHHEDYFMPLEVMWMCRQCHVNHHKGKEVAPREEI